MGGIEANLVSDGAEDAGNAVILGGPGSFPAEDTVDCGVGVEGTHDALASRSAGAAVEAEIGNEVGRDVVGLNSLTEVPGPFSTVLHDTAVEGRDERLVVVLVVSVVGGILLEDGKERSGVLLVQDGHVEGEEEVEALLGRGREQIFDGAGGPRVDNILNVQREGVDTEVLGVADVGLSLLNGRETAHLAYVSGCLGRRDLRCIHTM